MIFSDRFTLVILILIGRAEHGTTLGSHCCGSTLPDLVADVLAYEDPGEMTAIFNRLMVSSLSRNSTDLLGHGPSREWLLGPGGYLG